MEHFYAIVSPAAKTNALTKGRSSYNQPNYNVSRRYSLDGKTLLVEGLFTPEEVAWFEKNGTILGDAVAARAYLQTNRAEWETEEQ